ncbi:O-antigen ligase family protein [bacterium]|nr:O-antigen ligase family protein [bacterium]
MKKKKRFLQAKEKEENSPLRFVTLVSVGIFLFLRFFFDGLSYTYFNFFWNIYFFLLLIVQLIFRKDKNLFYKEEVLIFLFFLFSVISSNVAPVKNNGILYNAQILAYISIFSLIIHNLKKTDVKTLNLVLLVSAFLITLYGLYQYFWGLEETRKMVFSNPEFLKNLPPTFLERLESKRIFATFTYPNVYASFLLFLIPTSLFMYISENTELVKILAISVLITSLVNLILTGSLGGILICVFVAILMLLFIFFRNSKFFKVTIISCLLLQILVLVAIYATGKLPKTASFDDRLGYWQAAVQIFREKPVLGAGPGNYMHNYTRFKRPESMEAKHAHSIFFETLSETGIVGVLLLFSFFIKFIFISFKRRKSELLLYGAGFSFLAFFLHNLLDFNFINPAVAVLFFISGGIIVMSAEIKPVTIDRRLTKTVNYLIIITVFLTGCNYLRYTFSEKNIVHYNESKSSNSRVFYIDKAIKLYPKNFEVYEKKGDIYSSETLSGKKESFEDAKTFYLKAISLNPYSSRVYRKMAILHQQLGYIDVAEMWYLKVLENYPAKKQYNLEMAVFYLNNNNRSKAAKYYQDSTKLNAATVEEAHINAVYIRWIESQK